MEKSALISALAEEERKIQFALRAIGYYAHSVKFVSGGGRAPSFSLEARPWEKGDEELIFFRKYPELSMDGISEAFKD
jgi:hypothetical protein